MTLRHLANFTKQRIVPGNHIGNSTFQECKTWSASILRHIARLACGARALHLFTLPRYRGFSIFLDSGTSREDNPPDIARGRAYSLLIRHLDPLSPR